MNNNLKAWKVTFDDDDERLCIAPSMDIAINCSRLERAYADREYDIDAGCDPESLDEYLDGKVSCELVQHISVYESYDEVLADLISQRDEEEAEEEDDDAE